MLGIINATGSFPSLKKVTGHRSLAALPFGGVTDSLISCFQIW